MDRCTCQQLADTSQHNYRLKSALHETCAECSNYLEIIEMVGRELQLFTIQLFKLGLDICFQYPSFIGPSHTATAAKTLN